MHERWGYLSYDVNLVTLMSRKKSELNEDKVKLILPGTCIYRKQLANNNYTTRG